MVLQDNHRNPDNWGSQSCNDNRKLAWLNSTICGNGRQLQAQNQEIVYLTERRLKRDFFPLSTMRVVTRLKSDQKETFDPKSHFFESLWGSKSLFLVTFESLCRKRSLFLVSFQSDKWCLDSVPVAAFRFHNSIVCLSRMARKCQFVHKAFFFTILVPLLGKRNPSRDAIEGREIRSQTLVLGGVGDLGKQGSPTSRDAFFLQFLH